MIVCRLCDRVQSIRTPRAPSGVTLPAAKSLGWTPLGERWQCPICGKPKN
jgi:rubredoxin